MKRIGKKLQLVTMKTVTHVSEQVQQQNGCRNRKDREKVAALRATFCRVRHRIVRGVSLQHTRLGKII
jgi:hypothetical protein